MTRKFTPIKFLTLVGAFGIPATALTLFYFSEKTLSQILFTVFICSHCAERVWETFYTTRERKVDEFHGDWTLAAVSLAYTLLIFTILFEFFLAVRRLNVVVTSIGALVYLIAVRLRWWGIAALGKQWAIHAVGARKIRKVRVIRLGPYKYIRHPIYLAVMLELLSLPLIANGFFSLALAVVLNVPLQIIRLVAEERYSLRRFGESYEKYRREIGMLFPRRIISVSHRNVSR